MGRTVFQLPASTSTVDGRGGNLRPGLWRVRVGPRQVLLAQTLNPKSSAAHLLDACQEFVIPAEFRTGNLSAGLHKANGKGLGLRIQGVGCLYNTCGVLWVRSRGLRWDSVGCLWTLRRIHMKVCKHGGAPPLHSPTDMSSCYRNPLKRTLSNR